MDTLNDIISGLKWGNLDPTEAHDRVLTLFSVSHRFTKEDLETIKEHRDLMEDVITGDYKPDSFTNQPINNLISRIENGG